MVAAAESLSLTGFGNNEHSSVSADVREQAALALFPGQNKRLVKDPGEKNEGVSGLIEVGDVSEAVPSACEDLLFNDVEAIWASIEFGGESLRVFNALINSERFHSSLSTVSLKEG